MEELQQPPQIRDVLPLTHDICLGEAQITLQALVDQLMARSDAETFRIFNLMREQNGTS